MKPLREAIDELVADVPVYGDLDRAIEQAGQEHHRRLRLLGSLSAAAAVLVVIAGTLVITRASDRAAQPIGPLTEPTETTAAPVLVDGPVTPGRYRYVLRNSCDDPPYDCPPDTAPPPPLDIEVTVPAGWQHLAGYPVITPVGASPTEGPDGAALVLGWTNFWVQLYSDPCLVEGDGGPDVTVGSSVDDFVDAVRAREVLEVTKPSDVQIGGHPGRFFTLRAPSDISRCDHWRPWDPGFYAQGPDNIWDVWVIDVDGFRVLIVTDYFPGTPAMTRAQLREMVESISFGP